MKMFLPILMVFSLPRLFAETLIDKGYDADGAYVERLVTVPVGASAEAFVSELVPAVDRVDRVDGGGLLSLLRFGNGVSLVYTLNFGEFAELLNAPPVAPYYMTAQVGGAEAAPAAEQKGLWARSVEAVKANPWPSGILAFLAADYLQGDGIDAFGILGSSGRSDKPGIHIVGDNNRVTQTEENSSRNDNSNRPATAQPYFAPKE